MQCPLAGTSRPLDLETSRISAEWTAGRETLRTVCGRRADGGGSRNPRSLVAAEEEVGPPGLVALVRQVGREERVQVAARLERRPQQPNARLLRRLAALAVVARLARRDEVVPGVGTAAVARQDVIERQVGRHATAVLAGVPI